MPSGLGASGSGDFRRGDFGAGHNRFRIGRGLIDSSLGAAGLNAFQTEVGAREGPLQTGLSLPEVLEQRDLIGGRRALKEDGSFGGVGAP